MTATYKRSSMRIHRMMWGLKVSGLEFRIYVRAKNDGGILVFVRASSPFMVPPIHSPILADAPPNRKPYNKFYLRFHSGSCIEGKGGLQSQSLRLGFRVWGLGFKVRL